MPVGNRIAGPEVTQPFIFTVQKAFDKPLVLKEKNPLLFQLSMCSLVEWFRLLLQISEDGVLLDGRKTDELRPMCKLTLATDKFK